MNKQQIKRLESWVNRYTKCDPSLLYVEKYGGRLYMTDGIIAFNTPIDALATHNTRERTIHPFFEMVPDGVIVRIRTSQLLEVLKTCKPKKGEKALPVRLHRSLVNPEYLSCVLRILGNNVEMLLPESWKAPLLFAGEEIGALLMSVRVSEDSDSIPSIDCEQLTQVPEGWVLDNPWKQ